MLTIPHDARVAGFPDLAEALRSGVFSLWTEDTISLAVHAVRRVEWF